MDAPASRDDDPQYRASDDGRSAAIRIQNFREQSARHRHLGHFENYRAAVADNLGAQPPCSKTILVFSGLKLHAALKR